MTYVVWIALAIYIVSAVSLWLVARKETGPHTEERELHRLFLTLFIIFCPVINSIFSFFCIWLPWLEDNMGSIRTIAWSVVLLKDLRKK